MNQTQARQEARTEEAADDWVSALYDGESGEQTPDMIRRLSHDAAAAERWSDYSMVGDALRGAVVRDTALPSRIHAALAQEPTVLAPMRAPMRRKPAVWGLAAAAMAAVTWMVLGAAPRMEATAGLAMQPPQAAPYLAAHHDYAQRAAPDAGFRPVALNGGEPMQPIGEGLAMVNALPPGFTKALVGKHRLPGSSAEVEHWVFSNGQTHISLFIEPDRGQAEASRGMVNMLTRQVGAHRVTVVGEPHWAAEEAIAMNVVERSR